jgi:hypothetical protein
MACKCLENYKPEKIILECDICLAYKRVDRALGDLNMASKLRYHICMDEFKGLVEQKVRSFRKCISVFVALPNTNASLRLCRKHKRKCKNLIQRQKHAKNIYKKLYRICF